MWGKIQAKSITSISFQAPALIHSSWLSAALSERLLGLVSGQRQKKKKNTGINALIMWE